MKYPVVFAANNDYIQHFSVALLSLLENNKGIPFEIYLLNEGLSSENKSIVSEIIKGYNVTFENIIVNEDSFEKLRITTEHLSIQTFFRLLIPDLIEAERVLYLDSDLVVTGSLKELFEIDFEGNYILAVEDTFYSYAEKAKKVLKMDESASYFNAGIMVINVSKWKENDLTRKVISFAEKNPEKIPFADQDALNALINTGWKSLPLRYNIQYSLFVEKKRSKHIEKETCNKCIVHFTGGYPYKPWYYASLNPLKEYYWIYLSKTPFKDFCPSKDYKGVVLYRYLIPTIKRVLSCMGLHKK